MAEIHRFPWVRHFRADTSSYVLAYVRGDLVRRGRGIAFWFRPLTAAIVEVPVDDRELQFVFPARSQDHQEVNVQGVIAYRVLSAERLADRIDFSIDLATGVHRKQPLEQLASWLTGLAQQAALQYIARSGLSELLREGLPVIQDNVRGTLTADGALRELGIEVVDVRVNALSPSSEVEKALQTPTREALQQAADEATFRRRATAVEKERAIAENELNNRVELAKKEQWLIAEQGSNARLEATQQAEAMQIEVTGRVERLRMEAEAEARRIAVVDGAQVDIEQRRIDTYRDLPLPVVWSLAAQEIAKHIDVDHLAIGPDIVSSILQQITAQRDRGELR